MMLGFVSEVLPSIIIKRVFHCVRTMITTTITEDDAGLWMRSCFFVGIGAG